MKDLDAGRTVAAYLRSRAGLRSGYEVILFYFKLNSMMPSFPKSAR
jgi:hypothetical protein